MNALLCRGVLAATLEPGLEVVCLADHLRLLDAEPGLFDKRDPLSLGVDVAMGRVAQRLDLVLVGGTLRVLGGGRVDEDENPSGTKHAGHLAHRERHVVEMVGRESWGYDVEARLG